MDLFKGLYISLWFSSTYYILYLRISYWLYNTNSKVSILSSAKFTVTNKGSKAQWHALRYFYPNKL